MKRGWLVAAALLLVACGGGPARSGEQVLVSAAASLTNAFRALEVAFEDAHPGVDVVLNIGPTPGLRAQILEGAPVDVFASADEENMAALVRAGAVAGQPQGFATNGMTIVVPAGNPGGVTGLEDFAREDLLIGLCAEPVPCGRYARTVLEKAGVAPTVDTEEPDVRTLLTKVAAGELDAGIVYTTDAFAVEGVEEIPIPGPGNVAVTYQIGVLADTPNLDLAAEFVSFVTGEAGRSILGSFGFAGP